MRNIRTRTSAVAATALLAALSLTACQGEGKAAVGSPSASTTGGQDSAAASSTPAAGKPADGGDTASGTSGGTGGTGGKNAGSSASKGGDTGSAVTTPCGDRVKVTYSKVSRPINHGLLTLTNTGSKACNAYHAPLLRFDEAQAATAINDHSRPQAVVTLPRRVRLRVDHAVLGRRQRHERQHGEEAGRELRAARRRRLDGRRTGRDHAPGRHVHRHHHVRHLLAELHGGRPHLVTRPPRRPPRTVT